MSKQNVHRMYNIVQVVPKIDIKRTVKFRKTHRTEKIKAMVQKLTPTNEKMLDQFSGVVENTFPNVSLQMI